MMRLGRKLLIGFMITAVASLATARANAGECEGALRQLMTLNAEARQAYDDTIKARDNEQEARNASVLDNPLLWLMQGVVSTSYGNDAEGASNRYRATVAEIKRVQSLIPLDVSEARDKRYAQATS